MEPRVTVAGEPEKERASSFRCMPILIGVARAFVLAIVIGIWQFYPKSFKEDYPSIEKAASSLPEQPSIAVLPFANMSNDPEQEYFCDGIAGQVNPKFSARNFMTFKWITLPSVMIS